VGKLGEGAHAGTRQLGAVTGKISALSFYVLSYSYIKKFHKN
jgi:hypothetical protein